MTCPACGSPDVREALTIWPESTKETPNED